MPRKTKTLLNELDELKLDYDPGELPARRSTRGVRKTTYLEEILSSEENTRIRNDILDGADELPDSDDDDDWVDNGDGADNSSEYDSGPDSDDDDPDWDESVEEKEDDTEISSEDDEEDVGDEEDDTDMTQDESETEFEEEDNDIESVVIHVPVIEQSDKKIVEQIEVEYDED
uniref:Uncharacterized protein n=1 Tax=viral metagenome TaxID=1070528 RepID=A0A6C0LVY2_9ZZZZ